MRTAIGVSQAPVWGQLNNIYHTRKTSQSIIHYYMRSLNVMTIKGAFNNELAETLKLAIHQIKNHFSDAQRDSLNIYLCFNKFQPAALEYIFQLVKLLNAFHASQKKISVYWSVNSDDEMIATGFDLCMMCDFQFEIVDV